MNKKHHTQKQFGALHRWLRRCAETCQHHGYTLNHYIHDMEAEGMEIPITEELMKEIFRTAYKATTEHVSTKDASTVDYEPARQALNLFFGQRGIVLPPWPSLLNPPLDTDTE